MCAENDNDIKRVLVMCKDFAPPYVNIFYFRLGIYIIFLM